jgi:hypothetical protein
VTDEELCATVAHADCSEDDPGVVGVCGCPCHYPDLVSAVEAAFT